MDPKDSVKTSSRPVRYPGSENKVGTEEMALWVKAPPANPDVPSSFLQDHMMKRKNQPLHMLSCDLHMSILAHVYTYTWTHAHKE